MNGSALKRRQLLQLLGIGAGSSAAALVSPLLEAHSSPAGKAILPFKPVRAPLPLPNDGLGAAEQRRVYQTFSVEDKLLVPEGSRADVIAVWGDRLAAGRLEDCLHMIIKRGARIDHGNLAPADDVGTRSMEREGIGIARQHAADPGRNLNGNAIVG